MIFVDDNSADKTLSTLENYRKLDGRIKIISNSKQRGILFSRVAGIMSAKGHYFLTVDADDMFAVPEAIEIMYNLAVEKSVDIVQFNVLKGELKNLTKVFPSQTYPSSIIRQPQLSKLSMNFVKRTKPYMNTDEAEIPEVKYDNKNQFIFNKLIKNETFYNIIEKLNVEITKGKWNYYEDELLSFIALKVAKSLYFTEQYLYFSYDNPFGQWIYNPAFNFDQKSLLMFDNCLDYVNSLLDFQSSLNLEKELQ